MLIFSKDLTKIEFANHAAFQLILSDGLSINLESMGIIRGNTGIHELTKNKFKLAGQSVNLMSEIEAI